MRVSKIALFPLRRSGTRIRPAITRVILGFDPTNSLHNTPFIKSSAVTDIERVNLALYDSYVVTSGTSTFI